MSKLISFRISESKYEEILLECNEKNISVTEWIEMQFAIAKKYKQQKNKVAVSRNLTIKQRLRLFLLQKIREK